MKNKKILIIEDEIELAQMIRNYLVKESYHVEIISDGISAMAAIELSPPDMILLDLMLPGIDGLEILRQLRYQSTIPVIIISAKETEVDRIVGLKLGADDYMVKPFSIKELVARVESLFRRIGKYDEEVQQKTIHYNNIAIDFTSRIVTKEGEPVMLTQKEFELFSFLLMHPRQALSKEGIYNCVWGNEYGDINTVTIHVQKLREKIGRDHDITTIRGVGYRFDGEAI